MCKGGPQNCSSWWMIPVGWLGLSAFLVVVRKCDVGIALFFLKVNVPESLFYGGIWLKIP